MERDAATYDHATAAASAGDAEAAARLVAPPAPDVAAEVLPGGIHDSHEAIAGRLSRGVLVLCDHASNRIPPEYDRLGLPPGEMDRHIAWDIGAAGVARRLAALLEAPALLTRFSRLLIDPNRGLDDPTLLMRISDGTVIPGNATADAAERARRIARFWRPYDNAIAAAISAFRRAGITPALVSVHSFTPTWRGVPRPWHAAVLYDPRDPDFSRAVMTALAAEPGLVVGDNVPYRGGLAGDTMDRHGFANGLPHVLVELRQDLITTETEREAWARRLAAAVRRALAVTRGRRDGAERTWREEDAATPGPAKRPA